MSSYSLRKNFFKYLALALVLILLAFMVSCNEEEDGIINLPLEGTLWVETSYTDEGCTNPDNNRTDTSVCNDSECYSVYLYDGKIVIVEHEQGVTSKELGTYTLTDNTIIANIFDTSFTINFSIVENQLVISFVEPESGCTASTTYTGLKADDPASYLEEISKITLEGTYWEGTSYVATNCNDAADNENSTYECTDDNCEVLALFNGDFSNVSISGGTSNTMSGTYEIDGDKLYVSFDEGGETVIIEVTYVIDGNILTISFADPFTGCDVVQTYKV
ncbi:MAG: hypothetical protein ACFHWX_13840 [Bacteroidota bacterium]